MLKELRTLNELKDFVAQIKLKGKTLGFVPTMGYLHDGHMSLVKLSLSHCDFTITSIYVNPSQFNDASDFETYPKDEVADLKMLEDNGCHAVFIPQREEIETLNKIQVDLDGLDEVMEGEFRPGHFKGVVEVVYRLFSAVTPDKAFFGQKDYQQLMVIKKMVDQAGVPVEIVGAPIVRESNGLAMSSRNSRLTKEGRLNGGFIFETLQSFSTSNLSNVERNLAAKGFELEYLETHELNGEKRLFIAGVYEGVRLIDNIELRA